MSSRTDPSDSFQQAAQHASQGLLREFLAFMSENAKWWLSPFLLVFGLLGCALALGATGAAPFLYTFF